jgi:hypothetical protein
MGEQHEHTALSDDIQQAKDRGNMFKVDKPTGMNKWY